MLRAVILTQYRRVTDGRTDGQTDGQTDGIAIASIALAMRALRRAVKIHTKRIFSRMRRDVAAGRFRSNLAHRLRGQCVCV